MASDQALWDVSYLSWKVFQKAVLSGKGVTWDSLMNADLVIGGMDFSIDFLYFLFLYLFIESLLISLSSSPFVEYDTLPHDCMHVFTNMQTLAKNTTVWPHPEELFLSSSKLQGYETIWVALLSMDLAVPM